MGDRPRLRWFHYLGPALFLGLPFLLIILQHTRCT
jgi:hypothetical protein